MDAGANSCNGKSDQGSTLEKPMLCLAKHWLYKILSKFFRLPGKRLSEEIKT